MIHKLHWKLTALVALCGALIPMIALAGGSDASGVSKVRVVETDSGFRLERNGEPFEIRGAGLEFGNMDALVEHGGNVFRTWRTDNRRMTGQEVLDRAHKLGLAVAMGIEIGRERHGFDYDDEEAVAAQLEYARGEVLKYKDHPALLFWIIGNEVNLQAKNMKFLDAINEISEMIHEVDGNHPTTTAFAGFNYPDGLAEEAKRRAPDLDFISIQMYGDIVNLPRYLREANWDQPYMVTEWGAVGHWEVGETKWGAPIEQNSSEKAASYRRAWDTALASDPENMIGAFVFLWGQKQERTPTWYGMFLADGSETEAIDVMQHIWTGEWPDNRSPEVGTLYLAEQTATDSVTLAAGAEVQARISVADPDGDALSWRWEVMRESTATQSGGDKEAVPPTLPGLLNETGTGEVTLTAPGETGNYRLFVYVYDGQGNAGHANIPFRVK